MKGGRKLPGLALVCLVSCLPLSAAEISAPEVIAALDNLTTNLSAELTAQLATNEVRGSYTTVWRQFEDLAIAALAEGLPRHIAGLTAANFDGGETHVGQEKNRLADFAIRCGTNTVEISIKAARNTGPPENDLGTFHDHENRRRQFAASFTLWVRYEERAGVMRAERVFFDRSWRFVGKSTLVDGVKYRKKDGNLRPKPWRMFDSGGSFWHTEAEFETAVKRAEIFRANELVKEHLTDLSEEDQRLLHDRLHEKFAPAAAP